MSDIFRNPASGDIYVSPTGQAILTPTTEDETMQRLKSRLGRWSNEWFADRTKGVPYRRDVLVKNPNMAVIKSALRSEIQADAGVATILSLDTVVDSATRVLSVTFEVRLVAGDVATAEVAIAALASDADAILELDDGERLVL